MQKDPALKYKFTAAEREALLNGNTPKGYIWNHHQDRGLLQLVEETIHKKTGNTGGRAIWGTMYITS